jgi:hypothetical protein
METNVSFKLSKVELKGPALPDLLIYFGSDLLSHSVAQAVPSAREGLTSVFGMGTGDPLRYGHRKLNYQ